MTVLSVLAPPQGTTSHLGTIANALEEECPEAFFAAFVETPELVVELLTGNESWAEEEKAIVRALAAAPDKRARDNVKLLIPAIVPSRFSGTRRLGAECLGRQVVMHDFDAVSAETFDGACERIREQLPDRFLAIHTTATERNADGSWRLRAVEILDREATPEEWEQRVKPHMLEAGADKQTLDIARLLYLPVRTAGYAWRVYEGPRTRLEGLAVSISSAPPTNPINSESLASKVIAPAPAKRREAAAKTLAVGWPDSGRHGAQRALAGALCLAGWSQEAAVDFLCTVCREAGNEDRPKREKTVHDTYKAKAEGRPIQGWTSLCAYVDGGILDSARTLLDPNADDFRAFEALVNKPAPEFPKPPTEAAADVDELGIQWGGWDKPQKPPVYLLEGLIPEAKVVTFFAEGGSVKTWSALSLAIAVATGEPWLGAYPVKKGRALVLDYEDGDYEFHRRVRYLTGGRNIPELGYRYGGPQIDSLEYWIQLAEYVQKHGITLVIFDSISAAMPGDADENSSSFVQGVKFAGRFTETGCTVVFIHHANKSGGMRGFGGVRDQSDVVFKFIPVSETDDVKRMRMECDKPGPQKRPLPVNVELTDAGLSTFKDEVNEAGRNAFSDVDIKAAIRLALSGGPVANSDDLRSATGKKQNILLQALKEMTQEGDVVKLGKQGYALDNDHHRTGRVLEQLDSGKAFATATEVARHSFVDPLFVDSLRLNGIICQSADGRWMRVNRD